MKISVIIPVFNAAPFLRKAVESALSQEETAEVLLIEDCSTDNSYEACLQIKSEYDRVKLFRHPDGGNHGAGASRNLGIEKASCDFIAFLDADDYYLPGRFRKDKEILSDDPSIDGVYNALGIHYYAMTEENLQNFKNRELTTVKEPIAPDRLFEEMSPIGSKGYFHCDTLCVRKSVFQKVGLFNTELKLTQDTQMWVRLAAVCRLAPGIIDNPVAIRGVHMNNRSFKDQTKKFYPFLYKSLLEWSIKQSLAKSRIGLLWKKYFEVMLFDRKRHNCKFNRLMIVTKYALTLPCLLKIPAFRETIPGFIRVKKIFRNLTRI